jgi:DNA-binding SARP family transcriptional activator/WD40 repeat protein
LLRVLGPLEVDGPDGPVSVGGPVPRRILSALLVRPDAVVSVDGLLDAAWGDDPPPRAERTLVSHITRLREALGHAGGAQAPRLERRGGGYRLVVAPDAVDAAQLEQILLGVKDIPPVDAVPALRHALALWRAPGPFADLQDTAYPAAEAARLVEVHGSVVEALIEALLEAGDPQSAAAEAEARLREMPLRERLWELLIVALYRQGRQGDALAAYRRSQAMLRDELGVDPGPGLRRLEAQVLAQDPGLLVVAAATRRPCPYRGLARYETADAGLFVGRERLVDELVARLVDERFLVVVGPSGAGKSSLVRAGLLPALAGGALPGSGAWSVAVIQPGTEPLDVLTAALTGPPDVLVIDQAEEALLAEEGPCLVPFGDRVLAAVDARTRIVLVLRADFYGLLAGHPALARRAGPATVLVGPPDERELRRIVTEPATRVGLRVDPALADLIVAEVRDRPGVLPVLSTALVRTWEHRDGDLLSVASYRAGGGVAAALQRAGEDAWAALADDAQRGACRRLLLRLAADEDGSWVRRWARRSELVRPDDAPAAAALAVLTGHRLVVARADDLGIAHEALLTGWPRLHGWLEDGRSRAAVRERLATAATAWEQADHDPAELYRGTRLQAALDTAAASPEDLTPLERAFLTESADEADRQLAEQRARADREARGRRRARLVAAGLAVALVFAASAGGYAINKQRQADSSQRQAQRAALAADASRLGALARASSDYDRALLLAAQAVKLNPSPTTESDLFATLLHGESVVATLRGPQSIESAGFSPDGSAVSAVDIAGDVLRWSTHGGPARTLLHLGNQGMKIAVARDGRLVVSYWSSSGVPTLGVLDRSGKRFLTRIPNVFQLPDQSFVLSQDRRQVVFLPTASEDTPSSVVRIWRIGAPTAAIRMVNVGRPVWRVAACGPATACANTGDGVIVRIRLSDATIQGRVTLPPDTSEIAASPDGRMLAILRPDGVIRLVDARTGAVRQVLGGAFRDPRPLAFSPDGRQVVAADFDSLLVWRVGRDGLPERHDVFGGRINFATWSRDGSTLAAGGRGGTVVLLDRTGRRGVGALITDKLTDDTTLWAMPGAIVVGQAEGKVVFVDPSSGAVHAVDGPVRDPAHLPLWMRSIATARAGRDGRLVVTTNTGGDTAVWDVASRRLLGMVDLPGLPPFLPRAVPPYDPDVWVSPDGRQAATIRTCAGPIVFDPVTRRVLRHLPPLPGPVCGFEVVVQGWTPDGHSILITRQLSATHSELLVVDATTGAVKLRVGTGAAGAFEAAEDLAGRFIALAMKDGMLQILDAKNGHPLAPPQRANDGQVFNVSISPDGRYIATSGEPPRLSVWDTRTFRQVGVPLPIDVNASDARARFAPDGRLVVASGTTLRAFTIDPAAWLARACQEARRTLTQTEFEEVLPGRPYRPACA